MKIIPIMMDKHNWTYKKLGECLSYIKNGANIKQTKGAEGIPITRIETLSGGVFNRDRLGFANIFTTEKYSQYIMDDGDILMSHINSKSYIGRAVLYQKKDNEQIIHGMNLLRLKVIPSIVYPNYISHFFKSYNFQDSVAKIRKDAVNQSSMAISDLIKIPIPIPPLAEQERIVAELDLLSSIIEKKKAQLKELDQLAQSIFYDMFGDPITNEKGWEVKKMIDLCENIVDCPHSTPKKVDYITKYPCIRTSELKGGIVQWETMQYLDENEYNKRIARLKPIAGDIVFGREGSIGDAVILPDGYYFSLGQRTMLLRANRDLISNIFLHRTILSEWVKRQIAAVNVSSTVAHVNIKDFKLFDIPLPPLPLQQEFADKVEAIERQKTLIQHSIDEVQTLFDSRMDYWFG